MLKLKYHKYCRKHEAVIKVKRMLTKAFKLIENYSESYLNIELTGITELDYREVHYHIERDLKGISDDIPKAIIHEKEYKTGFNLKLYTKMLNYISELDKATSYIADHYPMPDIKTARIDLLSNTAEEKFKELKYKNELLMSKTPDMFLKEYYKEVAPDEEQKLWPLTFTKNDLENTNIVIVKYQ